MYFATQPANESLPTEISQELAVLRAKRPDMPFNLFALIDCAFDETLLGRRKWSKLPRYSLYANTPLHALDVASPHLLVAPTHPAEEAVWLHNIFVACTGRPMLSILASTLEGAALQAHLRPFLVARTPDGLEWPVRWGDTRVLPALMAVIHASHREHLLSPLHRWWTTSRHGTLVGWSGTACEAVREPDFNRLPLDDDAFGRLVDLAEADAILANIHDTQPDLLRQHRPVECHGRVARHLEVAGHHGITAAGARQHFCVLALCLPNDFTTHPAMTRALTRIREGADYRTEIAELPIDFWHGAGR
ncbi:DUF4123 domain-containing protein [Aromatoleum toluvorans]|uniref:DUF4123 domain-containing protein n=1 Tax=Aromatoleum toluvorans TaxID=92002 RepID=A0ABX1PTB5_9RHOO|nr:DUF4123 domain-containing protein [Aromatoleum toluvorans]NMG42694.1 DUF4123 domain-containing protein [Aromatoleum toluvorans]